MAVKVRKNYSLDAAVVKRFEENCKNADVEFSITVEKLMKLYNAKAEAKFLDSTHAPIVEKTIERTMEKMINRMMKVLHKIHVDSKAGLLLQTDLYKNSNLFLEDTLIDFIKPELLDDDREPQADLFDTDTAGKKLINRAQVNANRLIQETRNKERKENQQENL